MLCVIDDKAVRSDIYINGGTILAVGEKPLDFIADKIISGRDRLAIPALINCHTHSYMSVFRNIADDLPFNEWLFDRIMPLENIIDSSDAYWGCLLACIEMIRSGTSTFCDMHMFPNTTPEAALKSGMRVVVTRGLSGGGGDTGGSRRINEAIAEIEMFSGEELLSFMIAPHAVYTCDREYLLKAVKLAEKLSLPLNTHLSESAFEVSSCISENGLTPVGYLDSLGFFRQKTLAAHCVHITEEDMDILAENSVSVAVNAKSNLKLGNGIAPVKRLLEKGVNICLGTDGAASNNSLNLFSEMNFNSLLHKGISGDASAVSAADVFSFATENAANALGIEKTGKIKAGYKADIAILDTSCPQMQPMNNPVSALCYSANGGEVVTTIINGKIVMEDRVLTEIDEQEVYYNIERIKKKLKEKR